MFNHIFERIRGRGRPRSNASAATVQGFIKVEHPKPIIEQSADGSGMVNTTDDALPMKSLHAGAAVTLPDLVAAWYLSQGFIGHHANAVIAQSWLVNKACRMPALDAIRKGWHLRISDTDETSATIEQLTKTDHRYKIVRHINDLIHFSRVFGIRIALFMVDSDDPKYYEKPFNLDGVTLNSYKGISQIDPIWCAPELTSESVNDPAGPHFYEPTFWVIGGKRYHRSHLFVYIPCPVPNTIKPSYKYGGMSIPQQIFERVYGAERTASEAPSLAMSKRLTVLKLNSSKFFGNLTKAQATLDLWTEFRDNYGVKIVDYSSEDVAQFDLSLADLDDVISSQFQLVAAIANVPVTKLLGTSPKGFNATGESEAQDYRLLLESIQSDVHEFVHKHYELVSRSSLGKPLNLEVVWEPLDSPTSIELAQINQAKATTAKTLWETGAISADDIQRNLLEDEQSGWRDLDHAEDTAGSASIAPIPSEPAPGSDQSDQFNGRPFT